MKYKNAYDLINKEYPISIRSKFPAMIERAYDAVAQIKESVEFLNWPLGDNLEGYLRNVAVGYQFKKMIENNQLPLKYRIALNKKKNYKYIEVLTDNAILTISQVQNKSSIPRYADYRTNHSLSNQLMFDIVDDLVEVKESPKYIILTYGGPNDELEFVRLGVPEPYVSGWILQIDLYQELCQIVSEEETSEEEKLVDLKQYLKNEVLKIDKV